MISLGTNDFSIILSLREDPSVPEPEWISQLENSVTLRRLTLSDVRETLRQVGFSDKFVESASKILFSQCQGSPLALQLMLEAVVNDVDYSSEGWSFRPGLSMTNIALPSSLANAIEKKIAHLDERHELLLLRFAALCGLIFKLEIVVQALQIPEHHITLILHSMEKQGLVFEIGEGVFSFVSGAFIQFLLLPKGEASRSMHRALAEAVSKVIEEKEDFELVFLRANLVRFFFFFFLSYSSR